MLKFIENIGDYFSTNYFDEDFTSKVLVKTGYAAEDVKGFNKNISPLKDRYFRFKKLFTELGAEIGRGANFPTSISSKLKASFCPSTAGFSSPSFAPKF